MTTIYLAGPIAGRTYAEATKWRRDIAQVIRSLGVWDDTLTILDPMRDKADPSDGQPLQASQGLGFTPDEVFTRDMDDVYESDIIVANLAGLQRGIGTLFEFGAAYALEITVVVYNMPDWLAAHPFLIGNDNLEIVADQRAAVDFLQAEM